METKQEILAELFNWKIMIKIGCLVPLYVATIYESKKLSLPPADVLKESSTILSIVLAFGTLNLLFSFIYMNCTPHMFDTQIINRPTVFIILDSYERFLKRVKRYGKAILLTLLWVPVVIAYTVTIMRVINYGMLADGYSIFMIKYAQATLIVLWLACLIDLFLVYKCVLFCSIVVCEICLGKPRKPRPQVPCLPLEDRLPEQMRQMELEREAREREARAARGGRSLSRQQSDESGDSSSIDSVDIPVEGFAPEAYRVGRDRLTESRV